MLSLWSLGLFLLSAPAAIAAPGSSLDVSPTTLPFTESANTAEASTATAVATNTAKTVGHVLKGCQENLRYTNWELYSDPDCQNAIFNPLMVTWDPCKKFQETAPLSSGVIFQGIRWIGGGNAQHFYACQQGFSCREQVSEIPQNPGVCLSSGGQHWDKIATVP